LTYNIKRLSVGPLNTNCYCLIHGKEAIIIDPGGNHDKILKAIEGLRVKAIIGTHGHFDHVLAVPILKRKLIVPFLMHKDDLEILELFGSHMYLGEPPKPDKYVDEGDIITLGDSKLYVLHTPGHTPGSICLYDIEGKIIFSGDTLFKGAFGRTDLVGGDPEKMFDSLKKIFSLFNDDFRVYPGHGRETTIGAEKKYYGSLLSR